MQFQGREEFVAAFRAWVDAKATPLGEIRLAQHSVGQDELALLSARLVDEHLRQCGGVFESLAAIHLSDA